MFFEDGILATHNILNHTFRPITEPKYESTLLYAKASHPDEFIKQTLNAKTEKKAVIQFQANHFTFLANNEKCHQPIIGAVSPIVSEATGKEIKMILRLFLVIAIYCQGSSSQIKSITQPLPLLAGWEGSLGTCSR